MTDELAKRYDLTKNDVVKSRPKPKYEFRGIRCPTDRCEGPLYIKDFQIEDQEFNREFYGFSRKSKFYEPKRFDDYVAKIDYECKACQCWGYCRVKVEYPYINEEGVKVASTMPNWDWLRTQYLGYRPKSFEESSDMRRPRVDGRLEDSGENEIAP